MLSGAHDQQGRGCAAYISVVILLYMCPHTTYYMYVSSYCYMYVSLYYCMYPRTTIYMPPYTTMYATQVCSRYGSYMCPKKNNAIKKMSPHTTIYLLPHTVCSRYRSPLICVLRLLHMCPHTTIQNASSYYNIHVSSYAYGVLPLSNARSLFLRGKASERSRELGDSGVICLFYVS